MAEEEKIESVKAPTPAKTEERELEDAMESMIELMSRMYRNQVIRELNQGTIEKFADSKPVDVLVSRKVKFIDGYVKAITCDYERDESGNEYPVNEREIDKPIFKFRDELLRVNPKSIKDLDRLQFNDAQTGNYSIVLTKLAKRLQRKLMSRFSNKRIDELANQVLAKSDRRSKKIFYQHVSKSIGVDPQKLLKKDGMTYDFNALVLETSQWAKKLRDETLEMYTANTLRAMTLGESIESILEQYDGLVEKRKNHAKFTARNQIASFNSIMNKTRAQKLGIKKAIWVSSPDERTRPSHAWRNGLEFELSKGLYSSMDGLWLLPGTDYQCRCSYRMILEDEE
ncbi:hypothetical protein [Vibrio phage XM1]|nr:hypothetical protein [Vibrio phage XM1]